ncbi:MAG: TIGR01777 family oxidoreductase [Acidimicrobiales bacterium]
MRVAVTGSTGFIGAALVASLRTHGHEVVRVVRGPAPHGEAAVRWDPRAGTIDAAGLEGLDGVVHLAGEPIAAKRWSEEQKLRIIESRRQGTTLLAATLAGLDAKPSALVSASGVDYYGDRGDEVLTEASGAGHGFLTEVCQVWEGATAPAADAGVRVATTRTGIVLSLDGGALPRLVRLTRFGLGGRLGGGRQWWSWITLADQLAAIEFLLLNDVAGPVNLTAPGPVTNAEFADTMGRVLHRPTFLPTPSFGPKLVLGEMAGALLFDSKRVEPAKLTAAGFSFGHAELEPALRYVLGDEG